MAAMLSKKTNWGDDDDEGDYETKVDSNGQKLRVRTKINSKGQTIRVTQTVKVVEVKVRVPKRVIERRNLKKFGEAIEGETNVTLQSKDPIAMEHPDDSLVEDSEEQGLNSLAGFILKQQERALEREHDLEFGDFDEMQLDENGDPIMPTAASVAAGAASSSGATGKYVAPGGRGGPPKAGGGGLDAAFAGKSSEANRDAESTLRVSNLSKAATEDDMRELFCRYGRVLRVSLPKVERKDERGNIYKEPKGFAYIAFVDRADAEVAMNALQGHGYDHLILKIEWAKAPSENPNREGGGGFRSGYGEKLAQDTKERVAYASNLTENK
jgi:translation initiation factor 3 subunit G